MAEITLTKAELDRMLQDAAAAAVRQVQTSTRITDALGGAPRQSMRNWKKSQLAWQRLSSEEKAAALQDQDDVAAYMADVGPIRQALEIVARAKREAVPIDAEILALARQDPEQFNTVKIECLSKRIHLGDGREVGKGQVVMCHPKLAGVLLRRGHARLIEGENDGNEADGVVTSIDRISRAG